MANLHPGRLTAIAMPVVAAAIAMAAPLGLALLARSDPPPRDPSLPPRAITAHRAASARWPGLRWQLLAGIGHVESGHGTAHDATLNPGNGQAVPWIYGPALNGNKGTQRIPIGHWLGWWGLPGPFEQAVGPMQFRPPTFTRHATDGDG